MSIRHSLAVFFCMMMAMALVWSKALLAISSGFLAIIAATDIQIQPFRISWRLTPALIRATIRYKPFIWVFALFSVLYILSIVYAGNLQEWWALTHMKLDFLLIPMSFALLRPFTKKEYMLVALSMVLMALWSSLIIQFYFYQDHYLWTRSLGFGASLPTPTNHIRYSIIIAMSMIICLALAIENLRLKYTGERWLYAVLAIYFFYFLHVLSIRSGLALGYAGIVILGLFYVSRLRVWKKVVLGLCIVLAPMAAYQWMPGFEQKINYSLYDFKQYMKGEGHQYSDSERWQSWRAGIEIGNQHPFFGTGTGKFRPALKKYYNEVLQKDTYTRPHNQWINVFTCFGLFGLIVFSFIMIYPMTFKLFWNTPLMPTLLLMQLLSMTVEHPLDTAVGTSLFLLFTVMGLSYQEGKRVRE